MEKVNLICIPYSGGSKYSLAPLLKKAPANLNPVVLELPGRGARSSEKLCDDINLIEEDIYRRSILHTGKPYAIYGHSMGGLLAFLLTKRILRNGLPGPVHLFITGTAGPSVSGDRKYHRLEKKDFIEKIKSLKGMPDEILENEDMMDYFEPIIRSDFKLSETYVYPSSAPFHIPISVIVGEEEDMDADEVATWKMESSAEVAISRLPGNHFFIFEHAELIMKWFGEKVELSKRRYL
jgi:surfactin synthase thioesterase subunit